MSCDKAFEENFRNFTFNMMLMPRQGTVRNAPAPAVQPARGQQRQPQGQAQAQPTVSKAQKRAAKAAAATDKTSKEQAAADAIAQAFKKRKGEGRPGSSKGGGKGGDARVPRLPPKLLGMCTVSSAATGARKFCYGYSIDGCAGAAPGASCPKGLHACMRPLPSGEACSGNHPTFACTR